MIQPLKIIFAGTPDFAAKHLLALINSHHDVVAVYCPPDKPSGRGKKLTPCATKALALENSITIEQPLNFKDLSAQQTLASHKADVMVVVAYGLLLPEIILTTPRLGCINVHGSILPKWRGAAPIQRSLEAGDSETGVTLMQMDKGLDTGDMILTSRCDITPNDTSATLYDKLADLGPNTLLQTLHLMSLGDYPKIPQDNSLSSYAAKLSKDEAELNWQLSAETLERKIRAYIPWPVAQFTFVDTENTSHCIRVWRAHAIEHQSKEPAGTILSVDKQAITIMTKKGALQLNILQLPGKKALPVSDILNGRSDWFKVGANINGLMPPHISTDDTNTVGES